MNSLAKIDVISPFDSIRHIDNDGEFWLARELMILMGYPRWAKFESPIIQAIENLELTGDNTSVHFLPYDYETLGRKGKDYKLSAVGCVFLVFNCDQRKPSTKKAQAYFLARILSPTGLFKWASSANETDKHGFVYLVKAENTSYFKIGKSKHPHKRLTQLQTGSPIPLTIIERVFSLDCCNLENLLHDHYEAYQVRYEWFDLPDECVKDFFWVATNLDRQAEGLLLQTDNTVATYE